MRRLPIVFIIGLLVVAGACGSSNDDPDPAGAVEPGQMMELDDETFVAAMIEHQEGAIEMAEVALERAEHAEVRQMARAIVDTQQAEVEQMDAWMNDWSGRGGHGMDHGVTHAEMGMDLDMDEFRRAEPFDRAFLDAMIVHHEGAIEMADAILNSTERDELKEMAREIIEVQRAEIEQMRQWRADWYGED
jgi:uncharacterized protein (DUF305 family)